MAQVQEGFVPSIPRQAWTFCKAALAWIWIPTRITQWYREEGAKEERLALIEAFAKAIIEIEKGHAGKARHFRTALGILKVRHNRVENLRRDGPGDDRLLGEIDPKDFERIAREGGTLTFRRVPWWRRGWGGAR
jgi:hypothetical protein